MAGMMRWDAIRTGEAVIVLQLTRKAHPDLPKVPLAVDIAKSGEARQFLQVVVHDQSVIFRPFVLPPGTPKKRVEILRNAFAETMRDREFLAAAKKAKLDIGPVSGKEVQKIVDNLFSMEPTTVAKIKKVLYK